MHRSLFALVVFALVVAPLWAAQPLQISNDDCVATNDPYPCCSGLDTGSCGQKTAWPTVWFGYTITNACEVLWDELRCDNDGDGNDVGWLVENAACTGVATPYPHCTGAGSGSGVGACTEAEHDAGTLIKNAAGSMQPCTAARVTAGQCDARFESTLSATGTDEDVPKLALCQKAFDRYFGQHLMKRYRDKGRKIHEQANLPAPGDNSDSVGQN